MANQEDYLDSLLNSVINPDSFVSDDLDEEFFEAEEGFTDPFSEEEFNIDETDDFLKEFDAELDAQEKGKTPLLNREKEALSDKEQPEIIGAVGDSELRMQLDDMLDDIGAKTPRTDEEFTVEEKSRAAAPEGSVFADEAEPENESPREETVPDMEVISDDTSETDTVADAQPPSPELTQTISEDHQELGDILENIRGDDDLSEIGDLLKSDEQNIQIEDPNLSSESEGEGAEIIEASEDDAGKSKKKKGKKEADPNAPRGVKGKVLSALFEDLEIPTGAEPTPEEIAQMEAEKAAEKAALKEQKKKEKEEQKAAKAAEKEEKKKAATEAKQAKAAAKKAKDAEKKAKKAAEKAAKAAEKTPVKKKPIIITGFIAVSLVLFVYLFSSAGAYTVQTTQAQKLYAAGDYSGAFNALDGLNISSGDHDFYQQARLMAGLQKSFTDYQIRVAEGNTAAAADALIRGLGKFNINQELAGTLGILEQYSSLKTQIVSALSEYGITEEKAQELYDMEDRDEYTLELETIVS